MIEDARFNLVFSKMREALKQESSRDGQRADVAIQCRREVSFEELDEIAKLREIVLETSTPEPILFTTT